MIWLIVVACVGVGSFILGYMLGNVHGRAEGATEALNQRCATPMLRWVRSPDDHD